MAASAVAEASALITKRLAALENKAAVFIVYLLGVDVDFREDGFGARLATTAINQVNPYSYAVILI